MEEASRPRSKVNWQNSERFYLVELIGDRIKVINNRRTDYKSNEAKKEGWLEISNLFAARFGEKWNLNQIKEQWKRLRLVAKKEYSHFRAESCKTGGGPPPEEPTPISRLVKDMCPLDFLQMKNPYDDDAQINEAAVTALDFLAGVASAHQ